MSDQIDPNRVYRVVCPGCGQLLGRVYARHADHITMLHAPRCPITETEHAKTIEDMRFAEATGWTEHLHDNGE
jgi:hypothetical protein